MRLLLIGLLILVPSAIWFFVLVFYGSDSPVIYVVAASMYVGLGLTLYTIVTLSTED